jgi:hypothetical protein
MAANWQVSGQYFESCSCDYLCPCPETNLTGKHTKGYCKFAMVFHIDRGRHGNTVLDDLNFAVVANAPGSMADANVAVSLIVDERATPEAAAGVNPVGSGQSGPMAALGLVTSSSASSQADRFQMSGISRSVPSRNARSGHTRGWERTPMSRFILTTPCIRLTPPGLAKATRSHLHIRLEG